jgi:hypothetical protein
LPSNAYLLLALATLLSGAAKTVALSFYGEGAVPAELLKQEQVYILICIFKIKKEYKLPIAKVA